MKNGSNSDKLLKLEDNYYKKLLYNISPNFNVVFKNYSASYNDNKSYVLKEFNIEIKQGEKIGIIGRTGAGKSSTISSILQFFENTNGNIFFDNIDISTIDRKFVRRKISYISQEYFVFNDTLRRNIDIRHNKTDEYLIELLKEANIYNFFEHKGGLDFRLNLNKMNISEGHIQIICFLRIISNLQPVVIMDEATSKMDNLSEEIIEAMKHKYLKNTTEIIIAHRINTVKNCDRIVIIDNGRIKEILSKEEINKKHDETIKDFIE